MTAPIYARWTGSDFAPLPRFRKECDATLVIGEVYQIAVIEERSAKAHAAYFALVTEAWRNLPEDQAERFPTPDALRKFALIKSGYATAAQFIASSKAEAVRIAAFLRGAEEYKLVSVRDNIVTEYRAESQSYKAMGKQRFGESQQAVRDYCAALIGVSGAALDLAGEAA